MPGQRVRLIFLLLAALGAPACSKKIEGKIKKVVDGDSVIVVDEDGKDWRVRIAGIDAPEIDQPFGDVAITRLSALVLEKEAEIRIRERRGAGVVVGNLDIKDHDVAFYLVNEGLAVIYPPQVDLVSDEAAEKYAAAQETARKEKRGIWRDAVPVPPWEFRRLKGVAPRADTLKR